MVENDHLWSSARCIAGHWWRVVRLLPASSYPRTRSTSSSPSTSWWAPWLGALSPFLGRAWRLFYVFRPGIRRRSQQSVRAHSTALGDFRHIPDINDVLRPLRYLGRNRTRDGAGQARGHPAEINELNIRPNQKGRTSYETKRILLAAAAASVALGARLRSTPGVHRHVDQNRQHQPVFGPRVGIQRDRQARFRLLQRAECKGRHQSAARLS